MGLFDKKFCDICGEKVNMLTQKKLSDGQLCSDCKHKLGSFTSGWKQRTVQDVKNHLEQREQNKQKYQQFNCTATAGGRYGTEQPHETGRRHSETGRYCHYEVGRIPNSCVGRVGQDTF